MEKKYGTMETQHSSIPILQSPSPTRKEFDDGSAAKQRG
jgi:hypothetical protein